MWLIQHIVLMIDTAILAVETITWMPTEAGLNLIFATLCFLAAFFDVCPRRVMAISAVLYLLLGMM